jgi:hypothetical protein
MGKSTITLEFDYFLDAKYLEPQLETDPVLFFWSSTVETWEESLVQEKIKWENNERTIARGKVSIRVKHTNNKFEYDDTIGVRMVVKTPNHDNALCWAQAGNDFVFIRNIIQSASMNNGNFTIKCPMILKSLSDNVRKGSLTLVLKNGKQLEKFSFEKMNCFSLCDENQKFLMNVNSTTIERELEPFMGKGITLKGLYEEAEKLHDPILSAELDVPAIFFWIEYKRRTIQEEFFDNALNIVLARRNITLEELVNRVDAQFSEKSDIVRDETILVVRILTDLVSLLSVSLRYKTDETYRQSKKVKDEKHMVLELFFDAYTYLAGDCEDVSALMHDMFRCILRGKPEFKDTKGWHTRFGGWRSNGMNAMQMIANQYIGAGILGIVTSRWLGEDDSKPKTPKPVIIDSEEDKNVELGGHMFYLLTPIPTFEQFHNNLRAPNSEPFKIFKDGSSDIKPWAKNLPCTIGEGTGPMDGLLKPEPEYYKSEEFKRKCVEEIENRNNTLIEIAKRTCAIKKAAIQLYQMRTKSVPRARASRFYRFVISMKTDQLLKEGLPPYCFIWVTDLKKKESHKSKDVISGWFDEDEEVDTDLPSGWRCGANIEDILNKESWVGLFALPGMSQLEVKAAKAKLRHFMPKRPITLSNKTQLTFEYESKLSSFRTKMDTIFKGRGKETNEIKRMFVEHRYFDAVFKSEDLFNEKIEKQVLADVVSFKHIKSYELFVEPITDEVVVIRIRFFCEYVSTPYPIFDYEKQDKRHSESKISNNNNDTTKKDITECHDNVEIQHNVHESFLDVVTKMKLSKTSVMVKWESLGGYINKTIYTFPDENMKEDFIKALLFDMQIETSSREFATTVINEMELRKGASFAMHEWNRLKVMGFKLILSHGDHKQYSKNQNTKGKLKLFGSISKSNTDGHRK